MAFFTFKNHQVHYEVNGEGEPLVLLNGIMMSVNSWNFAVETVSKVMKLIRVDFFDQGQTDDYLDEVYDHSIQAALVVALLDHLGIEKAHIAGISYGGEVAIRLGIYYPERVKTLSLYNTAATTNPWLRDIGRGWNKISDDSDGNAYYNATIPPVYSPKFYIENNEWMENRRKILEPFFASPKFKSRMKRLVDSSEYLDLREEVHKIEAPTLIITSEYDFLIPKFEQEFLHKNIKNSHYMMIPDYGHGWMYEEPTLFVTVMIGFVLSGGCVRV
jgi:pimeloyl-ACP methyl ester carboxylesterase